MLVKVLDLPMDDSATYTGFTDDAPNWLKPYLAAALRAGVTENWPDGAVFAQSEAITGTEAALLVQNSLDLTVSALSGKDESDLPTWAATAMQAMAENGIVMGMNALTRADVARILYQISKMR